MWGCLKGGSCKLVELTRGRLINKRAFPSSIIADFLIAKKFKINVEQLELLPITNVDLYLIFAFVSNILGPG